MRDALSLDARLVLLYNSTRYEDSRPAILMSTRISRDEEVTIRVCSCCVPPRTSQPMRG